MTRREAKRLRAIVELAVISLDDKTASEGVSLFPRLTESGGLISAGTRINWKGSIKRATSDLWDTAENNPDNASNLWENIEYKQGYRIIPEIITAGAAFIEDECGWWENTLYRSKINANVYTPTAYPNGWEIVN